MRKLEFEKFWESDGYVLFCIKEQTHRGTDFTPTGNTFEYLQSVVMPRSANWSCHVRGSSEKHDKQPILCTTKQYAMYSKSKDKYNKRFKNAKESKLIQEASKKTDETAKKKTAVASGESDKG